MIDDVTTSGASLKSAVWNSFCGNRIGSAISIVDREEGAVDNMDASGIELHPLFKASEFVLP